MADARREDLKHNNVVDSNAHVFLILISCEVIIKLNAKPANIIELHYVV